MKRIWFAILLSFYFTTGMLAKGNYAFKADSRLSEGKWVKIEKITLSELTQTQKEKYGMYSFI